MGLGGGPTKLGPNGYRPDSWKSGQEAPCVPKRPKHPYTGYPATGVPDTLRKHQQTIRQAQRLAETQSLGLSVPWTEPTTEYGDDVLLTVHERLIEMHLSTLASNTYT